MQLWVSMHVSDHSGFHYRQFLLKELIAELPQAPPPASPQHQANGRHSHASAEKEEEQQQQQDFSAVLKLFRQEMALCSDLIQSYPGHEALWSHR